jgi:hypothetical protein
MSDTNPNTPTVEELTAQLSALRAGLVQGFGLGEDATDEALLARAAEIAKERDEARAEAADVESRWAGERVDSALRSAFEKSGAGREHEEDFLLLARGLFEMDEKGEVRTRKDAPNTLPGIDPAAWIVAELQAKRSHWWPLSQGASAKGGGFLPSGGADDSCFDPTSRNYNFTRQLALEAKYGSDFADRARARYRGRGER